MSEKRTVKLTVVGMQYRVTMETRKALAARLPVRVHIEREPDNEHDPNAIKVILEAEPWEGFHIGYINRASASALAPLLDSGKAKVARASLVRIDRHEGEGKLTVTMLVGGKRLTKRKSTKV